MALLTRRMSVALALAGLTLLQVQTAQAATETVLYSFGASVGDFTGAEPTAGVAYIAGTLYGTGAGGVYRLGALYSLTLSGQFTLIHSFGGDPSDGKEPMSPLTVIGTTLYGTTYAGGGSRCRPQGGCGTVYSLPLGGAVSVVTNDFAPSRGMTLRGAVIQFGKTALLGLAPAGGTDGAGTIYEVTPKGTVRVIHAFSPDCGGGCFPYGALIQLHGIFYGLTSGGGVNQAGTLFSITPSGVFTVLHAFGGNGDGIKPYASLTAVGDTLYGTTSAGGASNLGTIFSMTLGGTETIIHAFSGSDGSSPRTTLLKVGGELYGTTYVGGVHSAGTVFRMKLQGGFQVLHSFGAKGDGIQPNGDLIDVGGTFYGTTEFGGQFDCGSIGCGTIFSVTP